MVAVARRIYEPQALGFALDASARRIRANLRGRNPDLLAATLASQKRNESREESCPRDPWRVSSGRESVRKFSRLLRGSLDVQLGNEKSMTQPAPPFIMRLVRVHRCSAGHHANARRSRLESWRTTDHRNDRGRRAESGRGAC